GDMSEHWAKEQVELLASKLLLNGVNQDRFAPEQNVNRAEFASMLTRALGLGEQFNEGVMFSDIDAETWYAGEVGAAALSGLVSGFGDGKFRPAEQITREQLAVMAARAMAFAGKSAEAGASSSLMVYTDEVAISDWARTAVA